MHAKQKNNTVPFHFLNFSAVTLRSPSAYFDESFLFNLEIFSDTSALFFVGGADFCTLVTGIFLAFGGGIAGFGGAGSSEIDCPFLGKKFKILCR